MSAEGMKLARWTPERIRSYAEFEHFNDEEAEKIITTLERMAHILLSFYRRNIKLNEKSGGSPKLWKRKKETGNRQ
jgi:hypothetical protein